MDEIGKIVRLQVQRSSLKTGEKPNRVYDPAPILAVDRLAISPEGVLGQGPDRSWIVDIHHQAHPATKNKDGRHGVSVGFTAHYSAMGERCGGRISLGCAGENIIAETARIFTLEDLRGALVLLSAAGRELVRLTVLDVAHPCRPFTGWALGKTVEADVLKSELQFLDDGMRGFYTVGKGTAVVSIGDRLALL